MALTENQIPFHGIKPRSPLREEASLLVQRSKKLRADSERLRLTNSLITEEIEAISIHVNTIIFELGFSSSTAETSDRSG